MCEWFFECTMRALVGFRGVGWPVRWRHLSATWPISTAEISLSAHWELSQSVTDTRGTVHVILVQGFDSGIQTTIVIDK